MRDLKHLIAFENLLQEANNELVRQAKAEGKKALGYTCYFMPEVLLDLPGCFSVRLRAPKCTSPDIATYYMSGRTCHYGLACSSARSKAATISSTHRWQRKPALSPAVSRSIWVTWTSSRTPISS